MASLRVFTCLLGLVALCHSDCVLEKFENQDAKNLPKECVDKDGNRRGFGTEWVKDCMECFCTEEGIACCNMIPGAEEGDIPEGCELVVNKKDCSVKVVLKSDKATQCSPV